MSRLAERLAEERASPGVADRWPGPEPPDGSRLRSLAGRLGVTRLADLTGLDRSGCHVVQAVRPGSRSNVVSQGKGGSLAEATVSAVLEATEAWAAEQALDVQARGAFRDLPEHDRRRLDGIATLAVRDDWREHVVDWVDGEDLADGAPTSLPSALVTTDYCVVAAPPIQLFFESTTGLGAGPSVHHACLHGLLEWIERDAVAVARRTHGFLERSRIVLAGAEGALGALLDRLRHGGLLMGAWSAPSRLPLPVVWCRVVEPESPGRLLPFPAEGMACAFDPVEATYKALLEALQARVTAIAGAREDITRHAYRAPSARDGRADRLLETIEPTLRLDELPRPGLPSPAAALVWLLDQLRRGGVGPAVGVELAAHEDLGVAVVRIVVPGLSPLAA